MGNSPPNPTSLRPSNGDRPHQVQLGTSAALHFTGREVHQLDRGSISESWQVSYKVGKSTSDIKLTKVNHGHICCRNHQMMTLTVTIDDDVIPNISFIVDMDFSQLTPTDCRFYHTLKYISKFPFTEPSKITSSTTNALGGITDTRVDFFGRETRLGLVVSEWIKKSKDADPYMGTVAYYYVNTENGENVGLSVILKRFRLSSDGAWNFSVDGPEQHPVDALHYMFKQVRRTVTWKPIYCPHCANKYIHGKQSESESDIDNVIAPWLYGRRGNPSIFSNNGKFGNTFIKNLFNGRK